MTVTLLIAGFSKGIITLAYTSKLLHPSMQAASSNSIGIPLTAPLNIKSAKLPLVPILINETPIMLLVIPKLVASFTTGIIYAKKGIRYGIVKKVYRNELSFVFVLLSLYAHMEVVDKRPAIVISVIRRLFLLETAKSSASQAF